VCQFAPLKCLYPAQNGSSRVRTLPNGSLMTCKGPKPPEPRSAIDSVEAALRFLTLSLPCRLLAERTVLPLNPWNRSRLSGLFLDGQS
jgi:hypothetical protein